MATGIIRDRGRGPEIAGTRITVYHLLPYFLDPTATEEYIGRVHDLTSEEVAAARAYVLNNPDIVLAKHLEIEARIAQGNPPHVIERARRTRETFLRFKDWLAGRQDAAPRGLASLGLVGGEDEVTAVR
jgi:uncharacterized protein (DUF433 family)